MQRSTVYVVTKLLDIYGGLTPVLRFCVPLIVTWWRDQLSRQNNRTV
ncbi:unnamed protein product, partial [Rotaria sp. Silwood1]